MALLVRFLSISAERLSENIPSKIQYSMQLSLPSGEIKRSRDKIGIPFTYMLSSSPPVVSVTIKGITNISGDEKIMSKVLSQFKQKRIPQYIFQTTFQHVVFEALYIVRELGLPPPIPIPKREERSKQFFGEVI